MSASTTPPRSSSQGGRLGLAVLAGVILAAALTVSGALALAGESEDRHSRAPALHAHQASPLESSPDSVDTISSATFLIWGDWNCGGGIDVIDILFVLRDIAGFAPLPVPDFCPAVGDLFQGRVWGDTDCLRDITSIDGLAVGRFLAGLSIPPPRFDPACELLQQLPLPATPTPSPSATPSAAPTPTPSPTATPTATPIVTPSPTIAPTATPVSTPSSLCDPLNEAVDIPDNDPSGTLIDFVIPDTGVVTDIDLCINIIHDWVGDVIVTLTHVETGTSAVLIDRPGVPVTLFGCAGNDIFVYLEDEAASPVEDECGPAVPTIEGFLYPNQPLSVFNGESLNGIWTARVSDVAGDFIGRVVGATLWYSATPN